MGLFGRGEAPVGLILDGQPALRALLGEVLVWDGTRSAFLSAVDMTVAAVLRTPGVGANAAPGVVPVLTVVGGARGPVPTATSTPQAPAIAVPVVLRTPAVRANALVAVDPMTGAVQVLPGIGAENHDWNAGVPATTVSAIVRVPGVAANLNRQPPVVPVSALLRVPVVTATGSGTVAPQAFAVSAVVRAPVVSAASGAVSPVMTGSVSVPAPVVSAHLVVSAIAVTAMGSMSAPVAEAVTAESYADDFNRTDLGALWVDRRYSGTTPPTITSNAVRAGTPSATSGANAQNQHALVYQQVLATDDFAAEAVTVTTPPSGYYLGVFLRSDAAGDNFVIVNAAGTASTAGLYTNIGGTFTKRLDIATSAFTAGDAIIVEAVGNLYTVKRRRSGTVTTIGSWTDTGNVFPVGPSNRYSGVYVVAVRNTFSTTYGPSADNFAAYDL